jgi:hypothetical protein
MADEEGKLTLDPDAAGVSCFAIRNTRRLIPQNLSDRPEDLLGIGEPDATDQ